MENSKIKINLKGARLGLMPSKIIEQSIILTLLLGTLFVVLFVAELVASSPASTVGASADEVSPQFGSYNNLGKCPLILARLRKHSRGNNESCQVCWNHCQHLRALKNIFSNIDSISWAEKNQKSTRARFYDILNAHILRMAEQRSVRSVVVVVVVDSTKSNWLTTNSTPFLLFHQQKTSYRTSSTMLETDLRSPEWTEWDRWSKLFVLAAEVILGSCQAQLQQPSGCH